MGAPSVIGRPLQRAHAEAKARSGPRTKSSGTPDLGGSLAKQMVCGGSVSDGLEDSELGGWRLGAHGPIVGRRQAPYLETVPAAPGEGSGG